MRVAPNGIGFFNPCMTAQHRDEIRFTWRDEAAKFDFSNPLIRYRQPPAPLTS